MSEEAATILMGDPDSEFLRLRVLGRERPDATDYWDGNWLCCEADIAAGAFRGNLACNLRSDELQAFHEQLGRLYESLTGEAELNTLEHWLRLRIIGDGRGHLEIEGELCDDPAYGNTLNCRFYFDQTYLREVLRQLADVLSTYPVIGHPEA